MLVLCFPTSSLPKISTMPTGGCWTGKMSTWAWCSTGLDSGVSSYRNDPPSGSFPADGESDGRRQARVIGRLSRQVGARIAIAGDRIQRRVEVAAVPGRIVAPLRHG